MSPKGSAAYAKAVEMSIDEIACLIEQNDALTEALKNVGKKEVVVDASKLSTAISPFNPTTYEGTGAPNLLDNWHREMESVMEVVNCPNDLKVEQAAFYLRNQAGVWWHREREAVREYYKNLGELAIPWVEFKKAMRHEFFPGHVQSKLRAEFDSFVMTDSMTVSEYYHKFNELLRYAEDMELSQLSLALRFERGLTLKIVEKLPAGVLSNLKEVYERAGHAERLVYIAKEAKEKVGEKRKTDNEGSNQSSFKRGNHNKARAYSGWSGFSGGSCYEGRGGPSVSDNSTLQCINCGGMGHMRFECKSYGEGGFQ
ncbi:uncharacterized protein LOC141651267 [Silene latifolia]|uniref:uncharacterized protein LOC141651267 n=1 Tax=Silene latifolia TaxID=37657 RepID=UPI003D76A994